MTCANNIKKAYFARIIFAAKYAFGQYYLGNAK